MNKSEALARLGWDEKILAAFAESMKNDTDSPSFEAMFVETSVASSEMFARVEQPVLVSGILHAAE